MTLTELWVARKGNWTRKVGMRDDNSMSKAARQPVDAEMEDPLDDLVDLTAEQREEIDRRLTEHDRDPDSAIPWEEVRARLYRQFA
jgi:putative addiction module component (TIGR02574 family)